MPEVSKSTLIDAKAFLCWDVFQDIAIQLVPLQGAVAFYFPPDPTTHSIVLFYDQSEDDFRQPLFLLFHEAGHKKQFEMLGKEFKKMMAIPNGKRRQNFELEAWHIGRLLFEDFVTTHNMDISFLQQFDQCAQKSIKSYTDRSEG